MIQQKHTDTQRCEFSITDLSREFDISTRTLRLYEEEGLLNPKRLNTRRVFSKSDRTRLRLILRGKRLGFSLAECKEILDLYATHSSSTANRSHEQIELLLKKIHAHRQNLRQQLKDIEVILSELDFTEQRCLYSLGLEPIKTRLTQAPIWQPDDHIFR